MPEKRAAGVPKDVKARARELRERLSHKPGPAELLSDQELDDATPFYFALRSFVQELKDARQAAGLTLADVGETTGLAVETLSRLETGALTNPTYKTLAVYAAAVGRRVKLLAETPTS
jgi:DNA-binding XRE family transcriptional regulator